MRRALIGLLFAASLHAQSLDQILRDFANPPKSTRPWIRWWWPGGDVTPSELRAEIAAMDEAGFGGAEINPLRTGLKQDVPDDVLARINDVSTKSFYSKVRAALEEAKAHGMRLDLALGSGSPLGGSVAVTPELASLELRFTTRSVTGPAQFHEMLQLPSPDISPASKLAALTGVSPLLPKDWIARIKSRTRIVAVVAVKDPPVVLTKQLPPDGTLDWDVPAGEWQLYIFEQQPSDARVVGAAGPPPHLVLDHMNRAALEALLARVMDPAKQELGAHFGTTLRAVSVDSQQVEASRPWSDRFLDEFRKRRGYDLTPQLPAGQGIADSRRTVSDLWLENFFVPLADWARKHRLQSRVQAHGAPVDLLRAYATADIPETGQLYADGRMEFLKAASSAAHLYGRKLVSAEAFVHSNQAYGTTTTTLERDVNKLIAAGVNHIVYHGFPYVYLDRPEPGWHPFAPPLALSDHFNPHTKIWREVPRINEYIGRLQAIAQLARPVMRYAVYLASQDFPELATRDFDYINDDALARAKVASGRLVTHSGAEYEALVLPAEDAALRKRFPRLNIIIGTPPPDDAPQRWRLANCEFLFYYNGILKDREYKLPAGDFEEWDLHTGFVTPSAKASFVLETGAAQLFRGTKFVASSTRP